MAGNTTFIEKNDRFGILILDDDVCTVTILTKALRAAMPDALVLSARSVNEAQVFLAEYKIHFFVLDVHLPDGTGIDFLCDIQTTHPGSKSVIMTAVPLPEIREQATALGVVQFMEKPVDSKYVCALAQEQRDHLLNEEVRLKSSQFAALLSSLSSMDIIQLKCLGRATQALEFIAPQGSGRIYFYNGEIVHAETQNATGEAAFQQILSWRGGRVVEIPGAPEPARTITTHWQGLLLNAVHKIDEYRTAAAAAANEFPSDFKP
jgi:response regulator RpfG family c-di-GMP phosphodiesterase